MDPKQNNNSVQPEKLEESTEIINVELYQKNKEIKILKTGFIISVLINIGLSIYTIFIITKHLQ